MYILIILAKFLSLTLTFCHARLTPIPEMMSSDPTLACDAHTMAKEGARGSFDELSKNGTWNLDTARWCLSNDTACGKAFHWFGDACSDPLWDKLRGSRFFFVGDSVTESLRQAHAEILYGDFFFGAYLPNSSQTRNPDCAGVLGGGCANTGDCKIKNVKKPFECNGAIIGDYEQGVFTFGETEKGIQIMPCHTDIHTIRYCSACCDCGHGPELLSFEIEKLMHDVPNDKHVWWIIGSDGLHRNMDPSCIHSWWKDQFLLTLEQTSHMHKERGIVLHAVVYGIPPPLHWKKVKYAGETHAKNQNVEAVRKYNAEMSRWLETNVHSKDLFADVIFIDPANAVQQSFEIGEGNGDAAIHFKSGDGTHPGHMPNVANAQIINNVMYQSMES